MCRSFSFKCWLRTRRLHELALRRGRACASHTSVSRLAERKSFSLSPNVHRLLLSTYRAPFLLIPPGCLSEKKNLRLSSSHLRRLLTPPPPTTPLHPVDAHFLAALLLLSLRLLLQPLFFFLLFSLVDCGRKSTSIQALLAKRCLLRMPPTVCN